MGSYYNYRLEVIKSLLHNIQVLIRLVQKIVISLLKAYLPWLVSEWIGIKQYFIGHHIIHSCDLLQWVHRRPSCFNNWTYLTSSFNLHRLLFSNIWGKIISLLFHSRNPMGVIKTKIRPIFKNLLLYFCTCWRKCLMHIRLDLHAPFKTRNVMISWAVVLEQSIAILLRLSNSS